MQTSETHWLSISEVARIFRVSDALISREIHRGQIPFIKVGASYRISQNWVDAQISHFAVCGPASEDHIVRSDS